MRRFGLLSAISVVLLIPAGFISSASQKPKGPATYNIPLPARPDFSALEWLIGDWAGHTTEPGTDKESTGSVHLTVSYTLDKRFLLVHEDVSLPAGNMAPAAHESWTGFLSSAASGNGFVLRAFSSTGFITQYQVSVGDTQLRCDPQGGANPPPGFLFRRVISRLSPGFFSEKVEVAPPGGSFFPYYDARLTQVLETKASASPAGAPPSGPPAPATSPPR